MATEMTTKPIQICSIELVNGDGNPLNLSVAKFFLNFKQAVEEKTISPSVYLNGRKTNIFRYTHNDYNGNDSFIVPLGHLKTGVVYRQSEKDQLNISELTGNLYNINMLYYDSRYNIVLLTNFKEAPSAKNICSYFNSYIHNTDIKLQILPLVKTTTIENIEKSNEVKSVIITLDLGYDISKYTDNMRVLENPTIKVFKDMFDIFKQTSKILNSNEIALNLNVGDKKHHSTMSKAQICDVLRALNIGDNDCIKQIQVNYRKSSSEKIEKAYLKERDIFIKDNVRCLRSIVGLDNAILEQSNEIIANNIIDINSYQTERRGRMIPTSSEIIFKNPPEIIDLSKEASNE